MQGHLALMHSKSIFVMPKPSLSFGFPKFFCKSSNLGGLGLHVGITNTRVCQVLLCFAGTALLETFIKLGIE